MYADLMKKSDDCCLKAIFYFHFGEPELAKFYKNASVGFKNKALNLRME